MANSILLEVSHLSKTFSESSLTGKKKIHKAVDDVSFSISQGKTLGLVGESGSGKTTIGRCVLRLIKPDEGDIVFNGIHITDRSIRNYRDKMQIIFQNPSGSFDPKMRIDRIIEEGINAQKRNISKTEKRELLEELIQKVGLSADDLKKFPDELSGGQKQRICIARALAVGPSFIVCDEPVSSLDVSYQAQVLNLLKDLQEEKKLSYLFISHDLSVIDYIADEVAVMYLGRIIEYGKKEEILQNPRHPYTKELISAIPVADPKEAKAKTHSMLEKSMSITERGCPYLARCPFAMDICKMAKPKKNMVAPDHACECHLYD